MAREANPQQAPVKIFIYSLTAWKKGGRRRGEGLTVVVLVVVVL